MFSTYYQIAMYNNSVLCHGTISVPYKYEENEATAYIKFACR